MSEAPVSLLDIAADPSRTLDAKAIHEEIFEMEKVLRQNMDAGLTPEEMSKARALREAVLAAKEIADELCG